MNKKIFVSIIALGAIVAGSANAAGAAGAIKNISRAACEKSTKYVWVSGANNGQGACVKKKPCYDEQYRNFCNKAFENIRVTDSLVMMALVNKYYPCEQLTEGPETDDMWRYITCHGNKSWNEQYLVFPFYNNYGPKNYNESIIHTFKGACIAWRGDLLDANNEWECKVDNGSLYIDKEILNMRHKNATNEWKEIEEALPVLRPYMKS